MKLEPRTIKASKLRKTDLTPGVLYGKGMKSVPVQANSTEFHKLYHKKGTSKTFEITLEGKTHIVYIREVQDSFENFHNKIHFDLVKVAKDATLTSNINLVFLNHEEVEKRGFIVQGVMNSVEVEYAVGSGISRLEVDVAGMRANDTLKVSDIIPPKGVKILADMDSTIVSISTPKEEVVVDEDAQVVTEVESIKQSND